MSEILSAIQEYQKRIEEAQREYMERSIREMNQIESKEDRPVEREIETTETAEDGVAAMVKIMRQKQKDYCNEHGCPNGCRHLGNGTGRVCIITNYFSCPRECQFYIL